MKDFAVKLSWLSFPIALIAAIIFGSRLANVLGWSPLVASALIALDILIVLNIPKDYPEYRATLYLHQRGMGQIAAFPRGCAYAVFVMQAVGVLALAGIAFLLAR